MSWLKSAWYRNWVNWIVAPKSTFSFLRVCTFSRFDPPSMKLFFYLVFIVKFMGFKRIFHWESQTRHLVATTLLDKFLLKHFSPFSDSLMFLFSLHLWHNPMVSNSVFSFQIRLVVTLEPFSDRKSRSRKSESNIFRHLRNPSRQKAFQLLKRSRENSVTNPIGTIWVMGRIMGT